MDLKQLRAFLAVAETGNVTRASEILHLVQPAVSRQIRMLEEDVGAALFERERYGMALTEAGQALVVYARRALLELERAKAEIAGMDKGISGLVTLGLLPSTIDILSSELIRRVSAHYPDIRMRLAMGYAGNLVHWLESGEVDACLLYGTARSPEIETLPLLEETLWVIGPGGCGLRPEHPIHLAELANKALVLPSAPHGIRALVDHACAISNVKLQMGTETNALSVQRSLVIGGHGWTILPPIAVADDLRQGTLCGAPIAAPAITRTIVLGFSKQRATSKSVQCAVEHLTAIMKETVESGAWLHAQWLPPAAA